MRRVAIAYIACLAACSSTPAGTVLVEEDFSQAEATETHEVDVELGKETPSVITLSIASVSEGRGLELGKVTATVKNSNGWEVSFVDRGEPLNAGTAEAPMMAVPFMFSRSRTSLTGQQTNTGMYQVHANGTVDEP